MNGKDERKKEKKKTPDRRLAEKFGPLLMTSWFEIVCHEADLVFQSQNVSTTLANCPRKGINGPTSPLCAPSRALSLCVHTKGLVSASRLGNMSLSVCRPFTAFTKAELERSRHRFMKDVGSTQQSPQHIAKMVTETQLQRQQLNSIIKSQLVSELF